MEFEGLSPSSQNPELIPVLHTATPVQANFQCLSVGYMFKLSGDLRPSLPAQVLDENFLFKIRYAFLVDHIHATHYTHVAGTSRSLS